MFKSLLKGICSAKTQPSGFYTGGAYSISPISYLSPSVHVLVCIRAATFKPVCACVCVLLCVCGFHRASSVNQSRSGGSSRGGEAASGADLICDPLKVILHPPPPPPPTPPPLLLLLPLVPYTTNRWRLSPSRGGGDRGRRGREERQSRMWRWGEKEKWRASREVIKRHAVLG